MGNYQIRPTRPTIRVGELREQIQKLRNVGARLQETKVQLTELQTTRKNRMMQIVTSGIRRNLRTTRERLDWGGDSVS